MFGLQSKCTWLITSPPNTKIIVTQIQAITCCGTFTVGDGHDPKDTSKKIEIRSLPRSRGLVSEENTMYIDFVTELSFLKFELLFTAVENGKFLITTSERAVILINNLSVMGSRRVDAQM